MITIKTNLKGINRFHETMVLARGLIRCCILIGNYLKMIRYIANYWQKRYESSSIYDIMLANRTNELEAYLSRNWGLGNEHDIQIDGRRY